MLCCSLAILGQVSGMFRKIGDNVRQLLDPAGPSLDLFHGRAEAAGKADRTVFSVSGHGKSSRQRSSRAGLGIALLLNAPWRALARNGYLSRSQIDLNMLMHEFPFLGEMRSSRMASGMPSCFSGFVEIAAFCCLLWSSL